MMGIGFFELIFLILIYPLAALLGAVTIGIGIALGFRWGGRWLLKIVYTDPEFEKWLKRIFNPSENKINNSILESTTENRNASN